VRHRELHRRHGQPWTEISTVDLKQNTAESTKYGWIYIKQTQNDNLTSDPPSLLDAAAVTVEVVGPQC
jgi:hypothetical protein